ncbi:MAG: c-type cytochrome [Chromatiales bacterium]|nr:c-type cytochrome [Chromatiales bacterium]
MKFIALILLFVLGLAQAGASGAGPAAEEAPGGPATTARRLSRDAFSQPDANLGVADRLRFAIGKALFERVWVTAPASTRSTDGLGPLFNARSCEQCHARGGRGRPPTEDGKAVSLVLHLSIPSPESGVTPEPVYGTQLQDFAIPGLTAEGRVRVRYQPFPLTLADGTGIELRRPVFSVADLGYGPMAQDVLISPRIAPPMIGLGLLEAVDEADWLSLADPEDRDGDGISGRPNRVWSASLGRWAPGRFGWKAGQASLDDQNQVAFSKDIGISVPQHPAGAGECTSAQSDCLTAADGNATEAPYLEADEQITDLVLFYTRHLAVPGRIEADDSNVLAGRALFHSSGCAACHRPSLRIAATGEKPEQTLWPYTDLLLHDMGEGLADDRPEFVADGREWRTPPLWGIGLTEEVSGYRFFLHDGRARSILEAILWHGGEARVARDRVIAMGAGQRADLLHFLESL